MNYKGIRQQLRMTQEEFALLVGFTAKSVSRYERGLIDPPDKFVRNVRDINKSLNNQKRTVLSKRSLT
jgi:transcriptional regulator with XRE-family HTH domain